MSPTFGVSLPSYSRYCQGDNKRGVFTGLVLPLLTIKFIERIVITVVIAALITELLAGGFYAGTIFLNSNIKNQKFQHLVVLLLIIGSLMSLTVYLPILAGILLLIAAILPALLAYIFYAFRDENSAKRDPTAALLVNLYFLTAIFMFIAAALCFLS